MRIVGLDLSYTATGLAWVEPGSLPRTMCIKCPPADKSSWGDRVQVVLEELRHWYCITDHFVIEGAAWNQIYAAYRLGKLSGVVELAIHRQGIPYEYVPSSTIKKFATGNGRAKKEQMVAAARKLYPKLNITDHNEADALFMALWGLDKYGFGK